MAREESAEQPDWLNWFPIELYKCYLAGGCVMIRTSKGEILNVAEGVNISSCTRPVCRLQPPFPVPGATAPRNLSIDFQGSASLSGYLWYDLPNLKVCCLLHLWGYFWVTPLLYSLLQVPRAINSLQSQLWGQRKKTLIHCCFSELQVSHAGKKERFSPSSLVFWYLIVCNGSRLM